MTYKELIASLRPHAGEAIVLATVAQIWDSVETNCSEETELACCWALDSARRWALGEADLDEVKAASNCITNASSTYATNVAYATARAVVDASAAPAYATASIYGAYAAVSYARTADGIHPNRAQLVARMGTPGKWGEYRETHGLGMAGDYLWRLPEGRFVRRDELTEFELVTLDSLLDPSMACAK